MFGLWFFSPVVAARSFIILIISAVIVNAGELLFLVAVAAHCFSSFAGQIHKSSYKNVISK